MTTSNLFQTPTRKEIAQRRKNRQELCPHKDVEESFAVDMESKLRVFLTYTCNDCNLQETREVFRVKKNHATPIH